MDTLAAYLPQAYLPQAYLPSPGAATVAAARPMAFAPDGLKEASSDQRARAARTAQDFEGSFLSAMLGEMFEGTEVAEPFGGGEGETAFRSFMTEAMAKSMAKRGGVGLSRSVAAEMLKLQGLK